MPTLMSIRAFLVTVVACAVTSTAVAPGRQIAYKGLRLQGKSDLNLVVYTNWAWRVEFESATSKVLIESKLNHKTCTTTVDDVQTVYLSEGPLFSCAAHRSPATIFSS